MEFSLIFYKMSTFTEFFFPYKTFAHGIPLQCNNETIVQGEINLFHRSANYVSGLIYWQLKIVLISE